MDDLEESLTEAAVLYQRTLKTVDLQRAHVERLRAAASSSQHAEALLTSYEEALARRQKRLDELYQRAEKARRFRPL